mgnify:CR=1 FL=1
MTSSRVTSANLTSINQTKNVRAVTRTVPSIQNCAKLLIRIIKKTLKKHQHSILRTMTVYPEVGA